ncbi:pilus assembly protein TadG-related protein [Paenarthrobacter aurescens]|uniref:pilus assembly protein TadG-related protein n=1 Tax=Paenarthrobacter aurescens TaxID=43663 RepID=UPI0021C14710|nr:pilus assembly protein TadG-related protein [Paenarthrobacter aurescens]MCT9870178.1 pilus assembly protein TadG-related protein [Paenarthrobacter aurescens]
MTESPPGVNPREDGQMSVLIVGFVVLALLLATVVMGASAIYLEHKKLLSLADGAALTAADSFMVGELGGGSLPSPSLVDQRVVTAAGSHLVSSDAYSRHDHLVVAAGTGSEPGGTAVVVLTAVAHPPVISFLLPEGIVVEARSTARSSLTQ